MMGGSVHNQNSLSDDSEMGLQFHENEKYYRKYQLLLDRCESVQQDNERIVYRIQDVKKLVSRRQKEVKFLQDRLDQHGDEWRTAPAEEVQDIKPVISPIPQPPPVKPEKAVKIENEKPARSGKKGTKRKNNRAEKSEKDPNAPKRPANPFFQFCQEQRQIMMEQLNSELKPGEAEPTKQELTRQLAIKWKSLSSQDKKVYVDMYERSKEKYVVEMSAYNCKN